MNNANENWIFKASPITRRILLATGWLALLGIPIYIMTHNINITLEFVGMYSVLALAVGAIAGIYVFDRGKQDTIVATALSSKFGGMAINKAIEVANEKGISSDKTKVMFKMLSDMVSKKDDTTETVTETLSDESLEDMPICDDEKEKESDVTDLI